MSQFPVFYSFFVSLLWWNKILILLFSWVLAQEKPCLGHLSFCLQTSSCVSRDLVTDSKLYALSHFSTCQPGLHHPLLFKVVLSRDPGLDLISRDHSVPLKPALTWSMGFLPGKWTKQTHDRDQTDCMQTASHCRLLTFQLPFSQLEGALSKWTSYQDDVRQFCSWMDGVEASLNASERQHAELREKTAALGKAKVGLGSTFHSSSACASEVPRLYRNILEREMATHSSILAWRIPMDKGAWEATVHGVAKSQTRLSNYTHTKHAHL